MGIFKSIGVAVDNLRNTALDYIDTQMKLLKIQAAQKVSTLLSTLAAYLILFFFLVFFLLFASIAGAYVLSDMTGKPYAGFLIVSGIYLIIGFAVFLGREKLLRKPFLNAIIRQLFKEPSKEDPNGKPINDDPT